MVCHKDFNDDDDEVVHLGPAGSVHIGCFNCIHCRDPIREQSQLRVQNNQILCLKCYQDKNLEKCGKCNKPIVGEFLRDHESQGGKKYHKNCYSFNKCSQCNTDIYGEYVKFEDGRNYHKECYKE